MVDLIYGRSQTGLKPTGPLFHFRDEREHSEFDLAVGFCYYDFDIIIVVSKIKFQKKLNGHTRFSLGGTQFCAIFQFHLVAKNFDQ